MNLFVVGVQVKVCLQLLSHKVLRVTVLPIGESVMNIFSTLDLRDGISPEPDLVSDGSQGSSTLALGVFTVHIGSAPLCISVRCDGRLVQSLCFDEAHGYVRFPLGKGPLFGLGHGYATGMNRRGHVFDLGVNGQVRGIFENYSATSPSPYVISTEGWALYFHQPWKATIDLSGEEEGLFRQHPSPYADIFVVNVEQPLDAAREYYAFTGFHPMLPKYAFGYQQSYRTLLHNGVNYVEKTAAYMREHDLPCDVLIYLGTGYCSNGWNTCNGNFEWHPDVFPHPKETMQHLHSMNYKISLHITKCHTGLHGTIHDKGVSPLQYDHVRNYWKRHEDLYQTSMNEAWWPDDADEMDIEQRLTRHRMYYEGSLDLNPNVRPLQMQRNTFPGANKYGGVIWSGDVCAQWETLRNQVPIGLNAALSASSYWGTDTGGFFSTPELDGELFMRWFEYSTFTPIFRAHGRPSFLHNPWGWTMFASLDDMPLESASGIRGEGRPKSTALPDTRVEPLCRKYIHLRYSLLPYIYSAGHEATLGTPILRPLWFYAPNDPLAQAAENAYFFGDSFLVTPVTAKGAATWRVYLPAGRWYNYWTLEAVEGGRSFEVAAPLGYIPLFVKAGAIIPKALPMQYVDTGRRGRFEEISLDVYRGADGNYQLYEDDGISMDYERGVCTMTRFAWDEGTGKLEAAGSSAQYPGLRREISYTVLPEGRKHTITITY